MKKFSCVMWLTLVVLVCSVIGIFVYVFIGYSRSGVIWYYVGAVVLLPVYVVSVSACVRKTRSLHIHHYSIGLILMCFFAY
jgi:uncharacterized membrane protein